MKGASDGVMAPGCFGTFEVPRRLAGVTPTAGTVGHFGTSGLGRRRSLGSWMKSPRRVFGRLPLGHGFGRAVASW